MSTELDTVKSLLVELRKEIESIKTVYGNDEIRSTMKKSGDARYELDLIKSEIEPALAELKSILPRLQQQVPENISPSPEFEKSITSPLKTEHEQALEELAAARSDLESIRISFNNEIMSLTAKSEDARVALYALNSEYSFKLVEVQTVRSEISSLSSHKESVSRELDKARSELESMRSLYNSDEIQLMRHEIENTRSELSSTKQEKSKLEDEFGNINSDINSAKSELAKVFSDIDEAKHDLDLKNKDISTSRRELEFIEKELAMVHEKDEVRKLAKASATLVQEANMRYLKAEKELRTLQSILARKSMISEDSSNRSASIQD